LIACFNNAAIDPCAPRSLTITGFYSAFYEALNLAQSWLEQKRCEYLLIGATDELGKVMEDTLSFCSSNIAFEEGSIFFVLSLAHSKQNYGRMESVNNGTAFESLNNQPCQSAFSCAITALSLHNQEGL